MSALGRGRSIRTLIDSEESSASLDAGACSEGTALELVTPDTEEVEPGFGTVYLSDPSDAYRGGPPKGLIVTLQPQADWPLLCVLR